MTAARVECNRLMREGLLIPNKKITPTFAEFASGWWDWQTCEYLKNQSSRKDITQSYVDGCKAMTENQILPFFGDKRLDKITSEDINSWLLGFKDRTFTDRDGKTILKGYKNTYANTVFGTLRLMLKVAVERKLITSNPAAGIKRLKNDRKHIEIVTVEEMGKLFPVEWQKIWDNDEIAYAANMLASLTGMRIGEILGLRGEYVYDDHIYVCGQFGEYGYGPTKTKETRNIPLACEMVRELRRLVKLNGSGYVFSLNGGAKPVSGHHLYTKFHRALTKIGIVKTEISRRGLSFHSWRHFLNTELQVMDIPLVKVQSVTGHKSDRMSEWYSHFNAKEFTEVATAQQALLRNAREKANESGEQPDAKAPEPERKNPAKKTAGPALGRKTISFPAGKVSRI
jgi:integrase